jgi:hypothetical protein
MKYEVRHNQNIVDVALQLGGNIETWISLAAQNGLSLTSIIGSYDILEWEGQADEQVMKYYNERNIIVATGEIRDSKGAFNSEFNKDFN